jgi:hypothetical protein
MPWAVRVHERITKKNAKRRLAGPEDYVFMPEYEEKTLGYVLKMLQYQFDALLDLLDCFMWPASAHSNSQEMPAPAQRGSKDVTQHH